MDHRNTLSRFFTDKRTTLKNNAKPPMYFIVFIAAFKDITLNIRFYYLPSGHGAVLVYYHGALPVNFYFFWLG